MSSPLTTSPARLCSSGPRGVAASLAGKLWHVSSADRPPCSLHAPAGRPAQVHSCNARLSAGRCQLPRLGRLCRRQQRLRLLRRCLRALGLLCLQLLLLEPPQRALLHQPLAGRLVVGQRWVLKRQRLVRCRAPHHRLPKRVCSPGGAAKWAWPWRSMHWINLGAHGAPSRRSLSAHPQPTPAPGTAGCAPALPPRPTRVGGPRLVVPSSAPLEHRHLQHAV